MICIARTFGAPVTVPAGKQARSTSNGVTPSRSSPTTSDTRCDTWENRSTASNELYVPYASHRGVDDFRAFESSDTTLFMGDDAYLYAATPDGTPICDACTSDPDGDGWGYEFEQSCLTAPACHVTPALPAATGGVANDYLFGGGGHDRLEGLGGNDVLQGGAGSDTLFGGVGNDVVTGGTGNDFMAGGAGADAFVFAVGNGVDRITDWQDGLDRIRIVSGNWQGQRYDGFDDLTVTQAGGNAVVSFGGTSITLAGVQAGALNASDFVFI